MTEKPTNPTGPMGEPHASLPQKLTAEMACILEDCSGPEHQKPEAVKALIEMYQPMWDRLIEVAARRSPTGGDVREADIITGAMAIARSRGHDPDEPAPLTEMCTEDNAPVPWWMVFVEESEACLKAVRALTALQPQHYGMREALQLLNNITDLVDDDEAAEPLDDAIMYANKAIDALTGIVPNRHDGWQTMETAPDDGGFYFYGLYVLHKTLGTFFEAYYLSRDEEGEMREASGDNFSAWSYGDFEIWARAPTLPALASPEQRESGEAQSPEDTVPQRAK